MTSCMDNTQSITAEMASHGLSGLDPSDLMVDGQIHRFNVEGDKRGSKNGWYVLFDDGLLAGCFGSWRSGQSITWCSKDTSTLTTAELRKHTMHMTAAKKQREAAKIERQAAAAMQANDLYQYHPKAKADHLYLRRKQVLPHDLHQDGQTLLVPLVADGEFVNLQRIEASGGKYFLPGGRVIGAYHPIGGTPTEKLIICEGFATGATLHENTGHIVWCAMNAGNLLAVAHYANSHAGALEIIIAADNDEQTEGNPGVTKAKEAAAAIGAEVSIPPIAGDFNDIAVMWGSRA
jgi:putative DNA primase/helicase